MNHLKTITLAITLSLFHPQTVAMETPTQPEQTQPNEVAQDPGTLIQQAWVYLRGDGVEIAYGIAKDYLEQAKELDNLNYYLELGDCYAELEKKGYIPVKDWEAHKLYAKSFLNGQKKEALERLGRCDHFHPTKYKHFPDFVKGQYKLSKIFSRPAFFRDNALDWDQTISFSTKYLLKAAENGFPPAQYDLGQSLIQLFWEVSGKDSTYSLFNQCLVWFKKAARQGHDDSCLCLGEIFFQGNQRIRNEAKSEKYFDKACNLNSENFIRIAKSFKEGSSFSPTLKLSKNFNKASLWYRKALDFYGEKISPETAEIISAFFMDYPIEAAEKGILEAQKKMGNFYFADEAIIREDEKAFYWFTRAHENGDASGLLKFADTLRNHKECYNIYQKLYKDGNIDAIAGLGRVLFNKYGDNQIDNKNKAFKLFLESTKKQNKTVIPQMKVLFRDIPSSIKQHKDLSPEVVEEIYALGESCEGLNGYYLDFLSKFNGLAMADCFGKSSFVHAQSNAIAKICEGYVKILDNIHKAGFLATGFTLEYDFDGFITSLQLTYPYLSLTIHNQKKTISGKNTSLVWDGLEVINDETIEAHFLRLQDVNTKAIELLEKCDFKDNTILDVIKMSNENLHDYLSAVLQYQSKESDSDKMIEIIKVLKTHQTQLKTHTQFAQQMRERLLTLLDDTQDYRNWIFHQALNG